MSKAWKAAEKEVAEVLGGKRRHRVSYSESCEDVYHLKYSIEVKQGKQIPKYCRVKEPTIIDVTNGQCYHLWPGKMDENKVFTVVRRRSATFLERAFAQATSYDCLKPPIVGLKPKGWHGVIIVRRG